MQDALANDYDTYMGSLGETYGYQVPAYDQEEGAFSNAWLTFSYGTYLRSNEEICFAGDFFPYQSPSCHLENSHLPVSTQIHNPHEYAMDQYILEIVLNDNYLPYHETEPAEFSIGGSVDLTNQLSAALQGYVDLDDVANAIPTSITVTSLPACGVLYRQFVAEGETEYAILWQYTEEEGFVQAIATGDTVDFGFESVFYEADPTCEDIEYSFEYTVLASMPVEGPRTTMGLQVVETLWAADMGYGPSSDGSSYDFLMTEPPCGELRWCSEYGCAEGEQPDVMEVGFEYDALMGYYYFQTTYDCYGQDGELTDALNEWVYVTFGFALSAPADEPEQTNVFTEDPIVMVQGMP